MAEDSNRGGGGGGGGDAIQIAKMIASVIWALILSAVYVVQDIYHTFVPRKEKLIIGQHVLVSS